MTSSASKIQHLIPLIRAFILNPNSTLKLDVIDAGKTYQFSDGKEVQTRYAVVPLYSDPENTTTPTHYAVLLKKLGSGSTGTAFKAEIYDAEFKQVAENRVIKRTAYTHCEDEGKEEHQNLDQNGLISYSKEATLHEQNMIRRVFTKADEPSFVPSYGIHLAKKTEPSEKNPKNFHCHTYVEMPFVPGINLQDLMLHLIEHKQKLSDIQWISIIIALLKSLKALHEKGVTHRDIAPSQFMLHIAGSELLSQPVDFALARTREDSVLYGRGFPQPPEAIAYDINSESSELISQQDELVDSYGIGITIRVALSKNFGALAKVYNARAEERKYDTPIPKSDPPLISHNKTKDKAFEIIDRLEHENRGLRLRVEGAIAEFTALQENYLNENVEDTDAVNDFKAMFNEFLKAHIGRIEKKIKALEANAEALAENSSDKKTSDEKLKIYKELCGDENSPEWRPNLAKEAVTLCGLQKYLENKTTPFTHVEVRQLAQSLSSAIQTTQKNMGGIKLSLAEKIRRKILQPILDFLRLKYELPLSTRRIIKDLTYQGLFRTEKHAKAKQLLHDLQEPHESSVLTTLLQ